MTKHRTVLLNETIEWLEISEGGIYVDATLGGGGHTLHMLSQADEITVIAFDVDLDSIDQFKAKLVGEGYKVDGEKLKKGNKVVIIVNENFRNFTGALKKLEIDLIDGVIADLGFSSDQLEGTGMSFLNDEPLDMRLDKDLQVTAKDLVNGLYPKELVKLFEKLGDVRFAKRLANLIAKKRSIKPIETTKELREIVQKIVPFYKRTGTNKHPDAKVFQALRIAVNDELNALQEFLPQGFEALREGGVFSVISFHSGEDKIVKSFFSKLVSDSKAIHTQKLIRPTKKEVESNPRSRSAKLRIISKLPKNVEGKST